MSAKIFHGSVMKNSELYNKYNQLEIRDAEELIRKFNEIYELIEDAKISLIDIGSGDGEVLQRLVNKRADLKFDRVIGVDISKDMVEFATKKFGSDLITFHCADLVGSAQVGQKLEKFGAKLGSADIVTSFYCLHWTQDLRWTLIDPTLTNYA